MASYEDYKIVLIDTAYKLLLEHNVKQSTMFTWITEYLKEKVIDMPKVGVLYNNTHGGFGYSHAFKEFLHADESIDPRTINDDYNKDNRIKHVHNIRPFGKHMLEMETFNELKDVLCIHDVWNLDTVFKKLDRRRYRSETKRAIIENNSKLKKYIKSTKSKYVAEDFINKEDYENQDFHYYTPDASILTHSLDFSKYKKSDLLAISADKTLNKLTKEIQDIDAYVRDIIKNEGIVKEIYEFFENFHNDRKNRDSFYSKNEHSFVESIKKYGIDDVCSWRSKQTKFNSIAILFLLKKKKDTDGLNYFGTITDNDIINKTVFKFGLLCASDTYCDLDVAYVPALIDWEVGEYDGLENVYVV